MEREVGDVDGDAHLDIVISDSGLPALIVFNGNGNGGFTRETISTPYGSPTVLAMGSFTSPDTITDIAFCWRGTQESLHPLSSTTRYQRLNWFRLRRR